MKALMKTGKGKGLVSLVDVPEPKPGRGEVLIEVAACGVCGTDLHIWHDEFPYYPPVILGHEFAGTVIEVGPDCSLVENGARVVAEPHARACGQCYHCRTGNPQHCASKRSPGWGIHGGMAPLISYPEHLLHCIPDSMTWTQAAMVEPTANAVHNVIERAAVAAGETVVVVGPGPIGMLCAMAARVAGASDVIIVGSERSARTRFPLARDLGFTDLVGNRNVAPSSRVDELTGGVGADLVVECSGSPDAIASLSTLVRRRGRIAVVGMTGHRPVSLDWDAFTMAACEIAFGLSTSYTSWDTSIRLIAGSSEAPGSGSSTGRTPPPPAADGSIATVTSSRIEAERLVTLEASLDDWQYVFDALERREHMKAVFLPQE